MKHIIKTHVMLNHLHLYHNTPVPRHCCYSVTEDIFTYQQEISSKSVWNPGCPYLSILILLTHLPLSLFWKDPTFSLRLLAVPLPSSAYWLVHRWGWGQEEKGNKMKLSNIQPVIEIFFFPLQINISVTNHWRKFITPITPEKSVTTVVNDWFGRLLTALNFPWVVN